MSKAQITPSAPLVAPGEPGLRTISTGVSGPANTSTTALEAEKLPSDSSYHPSLPRLRSEDSPPEPGNYTSSLQAIPQSVPSDLFTNSPVRLSECILNIEMRFLPQDLAILPWQTPQLHSAMIPFCILLLPEFASIPSSKMRCHHLSWELFNQAIKRDFGRKFEMKDMVINWEQRPVMEGLEVKYPAIVNELTFHNAIAVMQNHTRLFRQLKVISIYLWSHEPPKNSTVCSPGRAAGQTAIQPVAQPAIQPAVQSAILPVHEDGVSPSNIEGPLPPVPSQHSAQDPPLPRDVRRTSLQNNAKESNQTVDMEKPKPQGRGYYDVVTGSWIGPW